MIYRRHNNGTSWTILTLILVLLTIVFFEQKIQPLENSIINLASVLVRNQNGSDEKTANIILGNEYLFSDTLIIDQGNSDNINIGEAVIAENFIAIGIIEKVGNDWARIRPFSQLDFKTTARAGIEKSSVLEISGIGGGEMKAIVPFEFPIQAGDAIWWGENPDYIIGLVNSVSQQEGNNLKEIFINAPLSLHSLANVTIDRNE